MVLRKSRKISFAEIQNTLYENKTVDKALYRELNLLGYYLDQYDAFDQYVSFTENLKTRAEQMSFLLYGVMPILFLIVIYKRQLQIMKN